MDTRETWVRLDISYVKRYVLKWLLIKKNSIVKTDEPTPRNGYESIIDLMRRLSIVCTI